VGTQFGEPLPIRLMARISDFAGTAYQTFLSSMKFRNKFRESDVAFAKSSMHFLLRSIRPMSMDVSPCSTGSVLWLKRTSY
jgi:hypothetical protein